MLFLARSSRAASESKTIPKAARAASRRISADVGKHYYLVLIVLNKNLFINPTIFIGRYEVNRQFES